jgi:hypothetical protein
MPRPPKTTCRSKRVQVKHSQTTSSINSTIQNRVIVQSVALFVFALFVILFASENATAQYKHNFLKNLSPETPRQIYRIGSIDVLTAPLDSVLTDSTTIRRVGYSSPALKRYAFEQDVWWAYDKFQHFSACFLITVGTRFLSTALLKFDRQAGMTAGAGMGMLAGFVREASDDQQYNNIFSLKDMLANTVGVLAALLLLALIP